MFINKYNQANVVRRLLMAFFLTIHFSLITFHVQATEEPNNPLQRFLENFKSLEASFVQSLINEKGEELERTEGILYLQQPGKFHWIYTTPYTQKIISDGDALWIFDEDLEQLTIREMGEAINQTPAGVILGNSNITEHFIQVDLGKIEGFDWIELTPRDIEAQYDNIRFGFDDNKLGMMIIADSLGQITRIDFSDVKTNLELDSTLFSFVIPDDVDVIDERQQ